MQYDRAVILKNDTFFINVDGKNCQLLGDPNKLADCADIETLLSVVDYVNLKNSCVELPTAQQPMPNNPGLPRSLVAVLYYAGRKSLVASLKELFQARTGVSWCTNASQEITQVITSYMNGLVADGLLDKIVDTLGELIITCPPGTGCVDEKSSTWATQTSSASVGVVRGNSAAQSGLPRGTIVKETPHPVSTSYYKSTHQPSHHSPDAKISRRPPYMRYRSCTGLSNHRMANFWRSKQPIICPIGQIL
ncbi:nuclear pore complex protein Nup205-like [Uranotaenia lowii]|uniref:nuclear pore complex protein Nup205-like n=1 Tax=Uranotaenia lowii TaxID=190385 RepID=UPI002478B096|nr:nuclear pore complex protein Nup205-like [Uranotaenia lowii]